MSVKAMALVWDLDLPHEQMLVLLAVTDHSDHEGDNIFPGVALIAWKTGYSERQIQRVLNQLVDRGILVPSGKSHLQTIIYRFNPDAAPHKPEYQRKGGDKMSPRHAVTPDKMSPRRGDKMSPPPHKRGDIAMSQDGDIAMSPKPSEEPSIEPSEESSSDSSEGGVGGTQTARKGAKATDPAKNLAPVAEAFRAAGLRNPAFTKPEAGAANDLRQAGFTPEQMAGYWKDVQAGRYGGDIDQQNLSFVWMRNCNRLGNWATWVEEGRPARQRKGNGYGSGPSDKPNRTIDRLDVLSGRG